MIGSQRIGGDYDNVRLFRGGGVLAERREIGLRSQECAFDERDPNNMVLKVAPMFDDVHSDPRWTKLMQKMGLAD